MEINNISLDTLCASLCTVMGIDAPKTAAKECGRLTEYTNSVFEGEKADRVFMYNPDAIGEWVYRKYPHLLKEAIEYKGIELPFKCVMPSVTPVCFGTMYTGAQPKVHGIMAYEKPVIKTESIFDCLLRKGKKCAIVSTEGDSLSKIFLERDMDYFIYPTVEEVNAKACELIIKDEHDFIVVYNRDYDSTMHRCGTQSQEALAELRSNSKDFALFNTLIKNHWKNHNSLIGFAMDHGCHEIDAGCGSHGLDMPEDLNIVHFYKAYKKVI